MRIPTPIPEEPMLFEINVFSRMREGGSSHVRTTTAIEFIKRLLQFKFGRILRDWQQRLEIHPPAG